MKHALLRASLPAIASAALLAGCATSETKTTAAPPDSAAPATAAPLAPPVAEKLPAIVREGSSVARAVGEDALYVAHEDLHVLHRVPLPVDIHAKITTIKLPGPPAAVLALHNRVLVTIRGEKPLEPGAALEGPGLLLLMRPDKEAGLVETARIELPADAWGIAVTPDESIALVTSAWTHKVSAVNLASAKKLWTIDVPREPRAVIALPDGKSAYVTHLVRATLTRIDDIDSADSPPKVRDVPFPAAPLRTPAERADAAKLSYAAVLSPDGARLFVPRQALGAFGMATWNGHATVDILNTADETPIAERPRRFFIMQARAFQKQLSQLSGFSIDPELTGPSPVQGREPFTQPRAIAYRKKTKTLLVAGEGGDELTELDALSIDPSTKALRYYNVRGTFKERKPGETYCGAPSGVALSADEMTAFVFCRTSHTLSIVRLDPYDAKEPFEEAPIPSLPLGEDPLSEKAAIGRRLFFDGRDGFMSGGYACAGCHPDGRDDGHVWHELERVEERDGEKRIDSQHLHAFENETKWDGLVKGTPRQTPMLAGRVSAPGPYGWKGRSSTLKHRVLIGFSIHHWSGGWGTGQGGIDRAEALVEFLRAGLVPPPREKRELTAEEQRGRELFSSPNVGCAECHAPSTEYTNRAMVGLGEWILRKASFEPELDEDWKFKTPSLLYVGGTPPYYHDGSSSSLEELIERNGTRMGHTKQLSPDDRAALIAFLRTL